MRKGGAGKRRPGTRSGRQFDPLAFVVGAPAVDWGLARPGCAAPVLAVRAGVPERYSPAASGSPPSPRLPDPRLCRAPSQLQKRLFAAGSPVGATGPTTTRKVVVPLLSIIYVLRS